jgi:hypothetical protein
MELRRIDSALRTCEEHLASLNESQEALRVEVETHLVAAMTLLIVSEYEIFIESSFSQRAGRCGDSYVANYVRSQLSKRFRSPDLWKVNEALSCFGRDYRDGFFKDLENTPEHAAWDNIMRARHAIVHRQGAMNLTFRELKESYGRTKVILRRLVQTLGM